eukprot:jgi/Psemu1/324757/estExt_fgenesh1_pg.C_1750039
MTFTHHSHALLWPSTSNLATFSIRLFPCSTSIRKRYDGRSRDSGLGRVLTDTGFLLNYCSPSLGPSSADHRVRKVLQSRDSDGSGSNTPFRDKVDTVLETSELFQENRKLQTGAGTRNCNEEFSTVTIDEVGSIFDLLMDSIDPLDSNFTTEAVNLTMKYDVKVSKVCLKCSQMGLEDLETEALMNTSPYGFRSYCSDDEYGWQATHSALVFSPVEPSTGDLLTGELRGFLVGHDTAIDVDSGPTDIWPDDIPSMLNENTLNDAEKTLLFQSFASALVAATSGAVALMPDYIGYGESKDYDRAYLSPMVYEQAAVVSYAAAKRYISSTSLGCTALSDVASITGYGEGGYFTVRGGLALDQNGVTVLSSRPGGTPFDLDSQLGFSFRFEQDESTALDLLLAFFGYAYSNDFSFLSNSDGDQHALDWSWMEQTDAQKNVLSWFDSPQPITKDDILALLPANINDLFNPAFIQLYLESRYEGYPKNACRSGTFVSNSIRSLCDSILDASLWNILMTNTAFPVSICHSPQDEIIGFENVPDPSTLPPNVRFYGNNIDSLNPRGGHYESMFLCALDPIIQITSHSDNGDKAASPVFRQPLTNSPPQCHAEIVNNECSELHQVCEGTQDCCNNLTCKTRLVTGGKLFKICSPPNRDTIRTSIAEVGVGGSRRKKVKLPNGA